MAGQESREAVRGKRKVSNKYAISITYSYRIFLTFAVVDKEIVHIDIGHHDEVY
jgi:mRNA-degrading endonuclease RelE of RelBE toxin-antitoxin system